MNESIGVMDPEWYSDTIEKIRRLNQRCKFEPFSIAAASVGVVESAVKEASPDQLLESSQSYAPDNSEYFNSPGYREWWSEMMEKIRRLDEKCCTFEQYYSVPSIQTSARSMSLSSIPTPHVDDSISSRKHNSFNSVKEASSSSSCSDHHQLLESQEDIDIDVDIDVVEISDETRITTTLAGTGSGSISHSSYGFEMIFEYFNSTTEASQKLERALRDKRSYIIGFHGKRGSGKTALVTAEKARYREIFDQVLFVTVPPGNIVDMPNLRGQIASQLNLSFDENISDLERSYEIKSVLENKMNVLVIFDDVSTILFDPRNIGIPNPSKQCKLLWITREKKYLTMRKCHHLIPLSPFSPEDAWKLLQQYSDIDDDDDDNNHLVDVAREVSARCKGLPGLIQDVVSSIVKKDSKEYWTELLDSLKHSTARHQIFISFRGVDTRDNFTYSLTRALVREGFNVFKDDEQLRSGDQVSEALTNAIKQSRLSFVVLSENYAQSSWCLGELAQILQCKKDIKQRVLPVFYKVDPSDIRNLTGSFGKAMVGKEEKFGKEKTQQWTSALKEIAGLSGKHYTRGPEYEFIQSIVDYAKNNKHCMYII